MLQYILQSKSISNRMLNENSEGTTQWDLYKPAKWVISEKLLLVFSVYSMASVLWYICLEKSL